MTEAKTRQPDNLAKIAQAANTLTRFLGKRDIPQLTAEALWKTYRMRQADILIVFGGMIPAGCDVAAKASLAGISNKLMIVGGIGHTTPSLRDNFHARYPDMQTEQEPEARMIADYLHRAYGIEDALLETESTNCGNNVTYALELLKRKKIPAASAIIMQDPSMQRRMAAGFEKQLGKNPGMNIICYAPYLPMLEAASGRLRYEKQFWGLWDVDTYLTLLLGDIVRLRDDANGYGPAGKNYIAHVDIPRDAEDAFSLLQHCGYGKIRPANERYKSEVNSPRLKSRA